MPDEKTRNAKPSASNHVVNSILDDDRGQCYVVDPYPQAVCSPPVIETATSFIVTTRAYHEFMNKNRIYEVVEGLLFSINLKDMTALADSAAQIKQVIQLAPLPLDLGSQIHEAYLNLGQRSAIAWPMVGSSEVLKSTQTGQCRHAQSFETLADVIKGLWASLFEPIDIFYRELRGLKHEHAGIIVAVQRM